MESTSTITFNAEGSQFSKFIKETNESFKNSVSTIKQFSSGLLNLNKTSADVGKNLKQVSVESTAATKQLKILGATAGSAFLAFNKLGDIQTMTGLVTKGVNALTGALADLEILGSSRLPQLFNLMNSVGVSTGSIEQFSLLGDAIKGNQAAIEQFSNSAVSALTQFESALAQVNTVYKAETKAGLDQLGKDIQGIVNGPLRNAVTSVQALNGEYQVLSGGYSDAAASQQVLTAGLKLATAGYADADSVLRLLVSTMRAYGVEAGQAATYAGKLNGVVELGITTIPELANGFGQTAATVKDAGVNIDQLGAAVATLTAKGSSTPTALTGIATLSRNIIDQTPEAKKALAELSKSGERVRFDLETVRTKGLTQALIDLNKAAKGNIQTLQKIIPDSVGFAAALGLISDGGKTLNENLEKIKQTGAEGLDKVFDIATEDRAKRFEAVVNRFQELLIEFGRMLAPTFEGALTTIESFSKIIQSIPDPIKNLIGQVVVANLAFGQLSKAVFGLGGSLVNILGSYIAFRAQNLLFSGELQKEIALVKDLIAERKGYVAVIKQILGINQANLLVEKANTTEATKSFLSDKLKGLASDAENFKEKLAQGLDPKAIENLQEKASKALNKVAGEFKKNLANVKDAGAAQDLVKQYNDIAEGIDAAFGTKNATKIKVVGDAQKATAAATTVAAKAQTVDTVATNTNVVATAKNTVAKVANRIATAFTGQARTAAGAAALKESVEIELNTAATVRNTAAKGGLSKIGGAATGILGGLGKAAGFAAGILGKVAGVVLTVTGALAAAAAAGVALTGWAIKVAIDGNNTIKTFQGIDKEVNKVAKDLKLFVEEPEYTTFWGRLAKNIVEVVPGLKTAITAFSNFFETVGLGFKGIGISIDEFLTGSIKGYEEFKKTSTDNAFINSLKDIKDQVVKLITFEDLRSVGKNAFYEGLEESSQTVNRLIDKNQAGFIRLGKGMLFTKEANDALQKGMTGEGFAQQLEKEKKAAEDNRKVIDAQILAYQKQLETTKDPEFRRAIAGRIEILTKYSTALTENEKRAMKYAQTAQTINKNIRDNVEGAGAVYTNTAKNQLKAAEEDFNEILGKVAKNQLEDISQLDNATNYYFNNITEAAEDTVIGQQEAVEKLIALRDATVTKMVDGKEVTAAVLSPQMRRQLTDQIQEFQLSINQKIEQAELDNQATVFKIAEQTGKINSEIAKESLAGIEADKLASQLETLEAIQKQNTEFGKKDVALDAQILALKEQLYAAEVNYAEATANKIYAANKRKFDKEASDLELSLSDREVTQEEYEKKVYDLKIKSNQDEQKRIEEEIAALEERGAAEEAITQKQIELNAKKVEQQKIVDDNVNAGAARRYAVAKKFIDQESADLELSKANQEVTVKEYEDRIYQLKIRSNQADQDRLKEEIDRLREKGAAQEVVAEKVVELTNKQVERQRIENDKQIADIERLKQAQQSAGQIAVNNLQLQIEKSNQLSKGLELQSQILESRNSLATAKASFEDAQLQNVLKTTADIEKRAEIEAQMAEKREADQLVQQEFEIESLKLQQQMNQLASEREITQIKVAKLQNEQRVQELQFEIQKAKINGDDVAIKQAEIQLKLAESQTGILDKQEQQLVQSANQQKEINANQLEALKLKQQAERDTSAIDTQIAKQNVVIAQLEKQIQLVDLQAREVEQTSQRELRSQDALEKAYERQAELLNQRKQRLEALTSATQSQLSILQDTEKNSVRQAQLKEAAAGAELKALGQKQDIERRSLEIQIRQNEIAQQRLEIENKINLVKNKAEIAQAEARRQQTQAKFESGQATDIDVRAAELDLQAKLEEGAGLAFEQSLLAQKRQDESQNAQFQREQLQLSQQSEYNQKLNNYAGSLRGEVRQRRAKRDVQNMVLGQLFGFDARSESKADLFKDIRDYNSINADNAFASIRRGSAVANGIGQSLESYLPESPGMAQQATYDQIRERFLREFIVPGKLQAPGLDVNKAAGQISGNTSSVSKGSTSSSPTIGEVMQNIDITIEVSGDDTRGEIREKTKAGILDGLKDVFDTAQRLKRNAN